MTVKAMKFGTLEFLTKPFDGQRLLDAVEQTLGGDSARLK
jgi:FixJ family two-component response regulator